jgi:hypothetical protein
MKKIIISVILMLALLMSFVACDKGDSLNGDTTSPGTQSSEPDKTVYDVLNGFTNQSYKKIKLDITTLTGDIELNANYALSANKVDYSIEQLNFLPSDGNLENVSPDYKTTIQGSAIIENGKVTKLDDEAVNLPEYDELKGAFDFKESYFKNIQTESGKFTADVVNVSALIGTDKSISDMKIVAEYSDAAFQKMTITYKTSNSTITFVYVFES